MSKQRVTRHSNNRSKLKGFKSASSLSKTLLISLLFVMSLLMTGTSAFLYKAGLDPLEFYSNMANPYMKLVNIPAGLRREEIALKFGKVLSWSQDDIDGFLNTAPSDERGTLDGYYLPGSYWVKITESGVDVAHKMLRNFNTKVSEEILGVANTANSNDTANTTITEKNSSKKSSNAAVPLNKKINLDTAVRIASIIQREAAGNSDMRIISGIIWNRIFKGMTLDMDATLQYAKASEESTQDSNGLLLASTDSTIVWWPKVASEDKYIDSPFNTYQNKGLPPIAISNPSLKAIAAALDPAKTDCLFYLHDNNRGFHCEKTYEAHKKNVQKYLIDAK